MRRVVPLVLAVAGLAFSGTQAQASVAYGISDQFASTFTSPLYPALKLHNARYVAPYDTMFDAGRLSLFTAWHAAAKGAHQKMLVSFEHSRTPGKEQTAPTVGQYSAAMKAFHKAFPDVKEINTWNEVNACQKGARTERQPRTLCKGKSGAKLLNKYYGVSRKVFKGSKIIPLDVLDDANPKPALAYIKNFKKVAKPAPKIWGVHNYSDTNRRSQKRTKAIIKAIGSKGEVWLLETGGQLKFGGLKGAANSLKCMFYGIKHNKRIKRAYIYQYNGAPANADFDAGIINTDGTARPGYAVVKARKAARC